MLVRKNIKQNMLVKVNRLLFLFLVSVGCSLYLAAVTSADGDKKSFQDTHLAVNKQEEAKQSSIDAILNLLKLQRENIKQELFDKTQKTKRSSEPRRRSKIKCHKVRKCKDGVCFKRRACHRVVVGPRRKKAKVPKAPVRIKRKVTQNQRRAQKAESSRS